MMGPFGALSPPGSMPNGAAANLPFNPFFHAGAAAAAAPLLLNGGFGAAAAAAAALQQQQQTNNGVSPSGALDPATLALLEPRPGLNLESTLLHYRLMQHHHQKAMGKRSVRLFFV